MPVHSDRGSGSGFYGFALVSVSVDTARLACCCLLCGEARIWSSNRSASRSLPAWWAELVPFPQRSRQLLLVLEHTWIWIHPVMSCRPSSAGAVHLFLHAQWIIITVIKMSGPLWGHRFYAGRSGNYGSCRQCFCNCTISDIKANRKPRVSAAAPF